MTFGNVQNNPNLQRSGKHNTVFNSRKMIAQNKAGKNMMLDSQIYVLVYSINEKFAMIPESPKQKWIIWENVLQCLDALDGYLYPKVLAENDWVQEYLLMHEAFKDAKTLLHTNFDLLYRMCVARYTWYLKILNSYNYGEPSAEVVDENTEITAMDDEESVTIYDGIGE